MEIENNQRKLKINSGNLQNNEEHMEKHKNMVQHYSRKLKKNQISLWDWGLYGL